MVDHAAAPVGPVGVRIAAVSELAMTEEGVSVNLNGAPASIRPIQRSGFVPIIVRVSADGIITDRGENDWIGRRAFGQQAARVDPNAIPSRGRFTEFDDYSWLDADRVGW
jgi:hypothetical protein